MNELKYYVYSRYLIMFIEVLGRMVIMLISRYLDRKNMEHDHLEKKDSAGLSFEGRISRMLLAAFNESQKPYHENSNTPDLISLIGFGLYNILLPLQVLVLLVNTMIDTFNIRVNLLHYESRTINKSQIILCRTFHISIIYHLALAVNAWVEIITTNVIDQDYPGLLSILPIITENSIFLLHLVVVVLMTSFTLAVGELAGAITRSVMNSWLEGTG